MLPKLHHQAANKHQRVAQIDCKVLNTQPRVLYQPWRAALEVPVGGCRRMSSCATIAHSGVLWIASYCGSHCGRQEVFAAASIIIVRNLTSGSERELGRAQLSQRRWRRRAHGQQEGRLQQEASGRLRVDRQQQLQDRQYWTAHVE